MSGVTSWNVSSSSNEDINEHCFSMNLYNFVCLTLFIYLFTEMSRAHLIVHFLVYPVVMVVVVSTVVFLLSVVNVVGHNFDHLLNVYKSIKDMFSV